MSKINKMKKSVAGASDYMYEYISSNLSRGRKIAVPSAILDQEGMNIDEMSNYYILEKGAFGLVNFLGFKKRIV